MVMATCLTLKVAPCFSQPPIEREPIQVGGSTKVITPQDAELLNSKLQRLKDENKVMGIQIEGDTIWYSTGLIPEEKTVEIENEIRDIAGPGFKVKGITH